MILTWRTQWAAREVWAWEVCQEVCPEWEVWEAWEACLEWEGWRVWISKKLVVLFNPTGS